ncbi:MAG: lipopolysaccharide biosynthesis protein [Raoultibacter sp.]
MTEKTLSAKQNIVWNSLGSTIYLGCQWLITILVVRLSFGYDAAGVLALAMAIGNLFIPFAIYKMRTYQVSDVDGEYSSSEYMGFRIITVVLALFGCMIYAFFTTNPEALLSIFLFLIFKSVELIIDVLHGLDQQRSRMDYVGKSLTIRGILSVLAFGAVLGITNSLELSILAMIIATAPVGFFYDRAVSRRLDTFKPKISKQKTLILLKKCLPAVAASVFCSAVITIPRQYLGFEFGDAALGIYASVAAPVAIVQMGATYIYSPLLGIFSRYYNDSNVKEFMRLFSKVTLGILGVAVVCTILFFLFGEWGLVLLYGESIAPYAYLLIPLIICTIATAYFWLISDLLIVMRDFRGNFIGNLVSLVAALPLTFFCVNTWDMNGVSFTGIIAFVVGIIVLLVYMRKRLHSCESNAGSVKAD